MPRVDEDVLCSRPTTDLVQASNHSDKQTLPSVGSYGTHREYVGVDAENIIKSAVS